MLFIFFQILVYLRTGCKVGGMEVVAFCMEDIVGLRQCRDSIKNAILKGNYGKVQEAKDFIDPTKGGKSIVRGVNSVRRSSTVYMSILPSDMQNRLRECKYIKRVCT